MSSGRPQKQWYISDKQGVNIYGVAELSSNPWTLKEWKYLLGPKEGHRYEPEMKMIEMYGSCEEWNFYNVEEREDTMILAAEQMWLLNRALHNKASFDETRKNTIEKKQLNCIFVRTPVLEESKPPSRPRSMIHLSHCDYLSTVNAVQLSTTCYEDVFSKNNVLTFLAAKPKVYLVDNPLACFVFFHQSSVDYESFYACQYSAALHRQGLHMLVQELNPQIGLHIETLKFAIPALAASNKMRAIQFFSWMLLGCIQKFYIKKVSGGWFVTAPIVSSQLQMEHVDISVEAIDCTGLLLYTRNRVNNEAVHNLFLKMCARFENLGNEEFVTVLSREALSTSMSIILSLLEIGAAEAAALHVRHLSLSLPTGKPYCYGRSVELINLFEALPGLTEYLTDKNLYDWESRNRGAVTVYGIVEDLMESGNIRGAVMMYGTLTAIDRALLMQSFLSDGELVSTFLNVLFQVTSPVILELPNAASGISNSRATWRAESTVLRLILVKCLNLLIARCSTMQCAVSDPYATGRGLFLLAYQGVSLFNTELDAKSTSPHVAAVEALLFDPVVPARLNQLMKLVNHDHPWDYEYPSCGTKRPRVAFLSFFLTRHSVGRLLSKIIAQVSDFEAVDVYIVTKQQSSTAGDDVTDYLRSVIPSSKWIFIPKDISSVVATVRSLELNILVFGDAFMDSFISYLAMFRMARTQVIFWGHPFTTGYAESLDYFITSDSFEPTLVNQSRQERQFTEQLIRFDSLSFQMFPTEDLTVTVGSVVPASANAIWPSVTATSPAEIDRLNYIRWILGAATDIHGMTVDADTLLNQLQDRGLNDLLSTLQIYGSLQSLFKMHPLFDEALVEILLSNPLALILVSDTARQSSWQAALRKRLLKRLTGIPLASFPSSLPSTPPTVRPMIRDYPTKNADTLNGLMRRVLFLPQMRHQHYSLLLCGVDVSLDPFPFGGGVTLTDAVGTTCPLPVPFVSSGQLQSVHRIGAGMAKHFNDSHLAYNTPDLTPSTSDKSSMITLSYVRDYAKAAVKLAGESLKRRLKTSVGSEDDQTFKASAEHIAKRIYDDTSAAKEWNDVLIRLSASDCLEL